MTKHEDAIGSLAHAMARLADGISCFAYGPSSHVNEGTKGVSEATRLVDAVASPVSVLASLLGGLARVVSTLAKLVGPPGTPVSAFARLVTAPGKLVIPLATLVTAPGKLVIQRASLVRRLWGLVDALAKHEPALSPLAHAVVTRPSTTSCFVYAISPCAGVRERDDIPPASFVSPRARHAHPRGSATDA